VIWVRAGFLALMLGVAVLALTQTTTLGPTPPMQVLPTDARHADAINPTPRRPRR
jgi:hypothetical protein